MGILVVWGGKLWLSGSLSWVLSLMARSQHLALPHSSSCHRWRLGATKWQLGATKWRLPGRFPRCSSSLFPQLSAHCDCFPCTGLLIQDCSDLHLPLQPQGPQIHRHHPSLDLDMQQSMVSKKWRCYKVPPHAFQSWSPPCSSFPCSHEGGEADMNQVRNALEKCLNAHRWAYGRPPLWESWGRKEVVHNGRADAPHHRLGPWRDGSYLPCASLLPPPVSRGESFLLYRSKFFPWFAAGSCDLWVEGIAADRYMVL